MVGGDDDDDDNIINNDNEDSNEPFAVAQHIILRNFWEYYLEEADKHGVAFGYVMGFENEWGNVSIEEIKPYIIGEARENDLFHIMPPEGYCWEDKEVEEIAWQILKPVLYYTNE